MGQAMQMFRSRYLALVTLLALCAGAAPLSVAEETDSTSGTAELTGRVGDADDRPLAGATVLAYHLSSEAVFESKPTGANGSYTLLGLPYGYYDLAVQTTDGLFVANQVVNLAPKGKTVASFMVTPIDPAAMPAAAQPRNFPGIDADPTGIAAVNEELHGREFWRSKKGVAVIAGSGAAALLLLASGGGNGNGGGGGSPSPSTP